MLLRPVPHHHRDLGSLLTAANEEDTTPRSPWDFLMAGALAREVHSRESEGRVGMTNARVYPRPCFARVKRRAMFIALP